MTQSVENPSCTLSCDQVSSVYRVEKTEKGETGVAVPFPDSRFFQIHSNKLTIYPVRYLSQVSALRITHCVFSFGVRKNAFNDLVTFPVKHLVCRGISGVIRQLLTVLPDKPRHCFDKIKQFTLTVAAIISAVPLETEI